MSHAIGSVVVLRGGIDDQDSLHHLFYLRFYTDWIPVVQRLTVR